jgi:hypothetical protein
LTISGGSLPYSGGGIYKQGEGNLTIVNSIIRNNQAGVFGFGGGIFNYGGVVTISNSTLSGNFAGQRGGAIYNASGTVTLDRCTIGGNSAVMGGGIYNAGGDVILDRCTIGGNSARMGGGIYNAVVNGHASFGLSNSTLNGNFANEAGGGIHNEGQFTLNNCTISGNATDGMGGGIVNETDGSIQGGGVLTISHCTLSDNSHLGIYNNVGGVTIGDTILSGVSGANIYSITGSLTSSGYNLSSDSGSGLLNAMGDQVNTNAMLGPLLDNGGPTFTHKLLSGSPAINGANPSFTPPPEYDQRGPGFVRVFDGRMDIGSFEVQPTPTPTRLLNISTRLHVLTGDRALIGGFIVTGNASKRVIVRAIGPSLTNFGVPGALADPVLELHGPGAFITRTNDNWRGTQQAEIEATGIAPTDDLESAIVATLPPGAYTAVVRGSNGGTGVGLAEAYDLESAVDAHLTNISTRGFVDTGENVMIGGFVLGNASMNARVLIRAIGPSLTAFGVPNALADPTLELHNNNGAVIAANDDWKGTQQTEIEATGIPPSDDRESAIVQTLAPGAYTAIIRGKNNMTGVALVEAYRLSGITEATRTRQESITSSSTIAPLGVRFSD